MNSVKFTTIGFVERHKGQDILIEAIHEIDPTILDECEFTIVGNKTSMFAESLDGQVKDFSCVKMIGPVNREEIHKILSDSDVLICPSREDSMPTVCAEAMMHKVPCIVSDSIGTATYICDGLNGLVFGSENASELKDKIIWCVNHREILKEMAEKAYEVYERVFSSSVFEQNLLMYVEEMIGKAEKD